MEKTKKNKKPIETNQKNHLIRKLNLQFPNVFFVEICSNIFNDELDSESLNLIGKIFGIVQGKFNTVYSYDANPAQGFFSPTEKKESQILARSIIIDLFEPLAPKLCGMTEDQQLLKYRLLNSKTQRFYEDSNLIYLCEYELKKIYESVMRLVELK